MPILRDGYATTNFTYLRTEFSQTLIFSNSCINPVIYCWRLGEICAAVKTHCRNSYVANDHVLRKVGAQNWQLPLGEKMPCILARKHYFNPQLKHCLHNRRQLISTASSVSGQFYRRIFVYKKLERILQDRMHRLFSACVHPPNLYKSHNK